MCGMGHLNSKSQGFFFCKSHTHFNDFTKIQETGVCGVDFRIKIIFYWLKLLINLLQLSKGWSIFLAYKVTWWRHHTLGLGLSVLNTKRHAIQLTSLQSGRCSTGEGRFVPWWFVLFCLFSPSLWSWRKNHSCSRCRLQPGQLHVRF